MTLLFVDGVLGLVLLGLWIFCLIDVITTEAVLCRNLQKGLWVLIVIFLFDLGAVLWLIAGRPWPQAAARDRGYARGDGPVFSEYDRPGRFAASSPEADAEFLEQCRQRAEQQRRAYREQRSTEDDGE